MRAYALLLQLWIISSAWAFFPWYPEYRCEEEGDCKAEAHKRRLDGAPGARTFQISQRLPREDAHDPQRVAEEAARLSRKYAHTRPRPIAAGKAALSRRENKYPILKPADTTYKQSTGIFQDGTDFAYFIQVKLGSKDKPLFMLVDTGAGTTWVMGSGCKSAPCAIHDSFGPGDSSTYQESGDIFNVAYGSGSVRGTKARDSVSVAGMKFSFEMGIANETSNDFNHFPFDGILGLSAAKGETQNFIQTVKESKQLSANIFCVYLHRASDGPNSGEISFGSCNPAKYTGDFTYTKVGSTNGDWAIPVDGLSYDGKRAGVQGKLSYIDTGTSFCFGPRDDVAAFHKLIPGAVATDATQTTYRVPCDSNKPVTFTFSGVSHTLSPKDWMSSPGTDGLCTSNIYGHEVVPNAWLLGDLFLKNVYTVFDLDQSRIGFADKVIPPPPVTSTSTIATPAPDTAPVSKPSLGPNSDGAAPAAQTSVPSTGSLPSPASIMSVDRIASALACTFAILYAMQ